METTELVLYMYIEYGTINKYNNNNNNNNNNNDNVHSP